jgi:glycosyltransferase involved in cell wall biosynthesis
VTPHFILVTPEYPPDCGGVGDYTRHVATALVRTGARVEVWTAPSSHPAPPEDPFEVHLLPDDFGLRSMRALGVALRALPADGVLLVQYVPHGFGWKGTNIPFAAWLGSRSERVWLMLHEAIYPFLPGQALRHDVLAVATRVMLRLATTRSEHVFVSTPRWESYVTRWGRAGLRPEWLPVPANLTAEPSAASASNESASNDHPTVAHFGRYGELVARSLTPVIVSLLERNPELEVVLIGRNSERFLSELGSREPRLRDRMRATGNAEPSAVIAELRRATAAVFPFEDGASSRRSTLMSALTAGAAIVTTEGPFTESLWRESGAVELAAADDPQSSVAAVERLLSDPARRAELRRRALELYDQRFHVDRIAARLRELAAAPPG